MSLILHAQPYDISAKGFYFKSGEEYDKNVKTLKNSYGQPVEEFEIQFIDGESIDCELAKAMDLNQGNFRQFFDWVDEWDDNEKTRFIIAVGEYGYDFDENSSPDDFELDLYQEDSLKDLAIQFVDEGLFGEIPKNIQFYIDYDAIARDLSFDYSEAVIAGQHFIYRGY